MSTPLTLEGRYVRLEPLAPSHVEGLLAAAGESRDTYGLTSVPTGRDDMARYVAAAMADAERGASVAFATVDRVRGRVAGSTRFCNLERWPWPSAPAAPVPSHGIDALEIGW